MVRLVRNTAFASATWMEWSGVVTSPCLEQTKNRRQIWQRTGQHWRTSPAGKTITFIFTDALLLWAYNSLTYFTIHYFRYHLTAADIRELLVSSMTPSMKTVLELVEQEYPNSPSAQFQALQVRNLIQFISWWRSYTSEPTFTQLPNNFFFEIIFLPSSDSETFWPRQIHIAFLLTYVSLHHFNHNIQSNTPIYIYIYIVYFCSRWRAYPLLITGTGAYILPR